MKKREMESKIKNEFEKATPDIFNSVSADLGSQKNEPVNLDEVRRRKKTNPVFKFVAIAAAFAILVGVGGYGYGYMKPVTSVSLDVNPSVSLSLNSKEKVLKCKALNSDGEGIIDGMDLQGASVDVAVNALLGSMVKNGYLDEAKNTVLVTVNSENGAALEERLSGEISEYLNANIGSSAVLSQTIAAEDTSVKALADSHSISQGKVELINSIIKSDPTLKFDELAKLTVNELTLLAESRKDSTSKINTIGAASSKKYVGSEAAIKAAQQKFPGSKIVSVEMDYDYGRMAYEVEIISGGFEYEVEIDALSGKYFRHEKGDAVNAQGVEIDDRDDDDDDGPIEEYFDKKEDEIESKLGIVDYDDNDDDDDDDYIPAGSTVSRESVIGSNAARAAALSHFGFAESDVKRLIVNEDFDEKTPKYEVEFRVGLRSYEAEIDALSGRIISAESEID